MKIESRNKRLKKLLTKKFLYKEYITNRKDTYQIAKIIGCTATTVINYLKLHKIKIRITSESLRGKYIGIKNSRYNSERHNIHFCKVCLKIGKKTEICYQTWKNGLGRCNFCAHKGNNNNFYSKHHTKITIEKIKNSNYHKNLKGKNHPQYIKNLVRKYSLKFKIIRELIRIRDEHICQICGKTTKKNGRKLDVHHIDYDKENLDPENLISLCQHCHGETNYNKDIYIEYFKILHNIIRN